MVKKTMREITVGRSADVGMKPTNPKDVIAINKLPLHLWPETATAQGALGLLNGALKYGIVNWRKSGVRLSVYIDAFLRHGAAYAAGEEVDPDDGVPHLSAMLACLAIIVDARAHGKLVDDRCGGEASAFRRHVDELTAHVPRLKELHAAKSPVHYTRERK